MDVSGEQQVGVMHGVSKVRLAPEAEGGHVIDIKALDLIEGALRVNKVIGNFHIAPGRSFSNGNMHVHDLNNYFDTPVEGGHVFSHTIHHLRFGPQLPEELTKKLGTKTNLWTNHHLNPLDDTKQTTTEPAYNFMYFVKVVSTSYLPLGWETQAYKSQLGSEWVGIGSYGHQHDGSVETHQYSVTSHRRSLNGGDDASEGHKEKVHARGGIPGVFFSYTTHDLPKFKNLDDGDPIN
ncbi:hypothetical protein M7I_0279 [Glarea lozoyensis 74030]|uniref:Endoplasmic reticulum-Golgi intermediate compartment protein n=1 Tax=Glarea lozoyensis (strain ATCC 74030 / MF5533) TaxID=1104152 RepID=H0ECY1_GLAL7|nr:hypothetical protein M7I_0279 [Glarea lozoyensis 74030]